MNKVKKTTLWGRLKAAARAFKGKPVDRLTVDIGVEVKSCRKCERKEQGHARWAYRIANRVAPVSQDMKCSRCDRTIARLDGVNYNYCPNCGATMDG